MIDFSTEFAISSRSPHPDLGRAEFLCVDRIGSPEMLLLRPFRSFPVWKSTNYHFYNSKRAEIVHFAAVFFHLCFQNRPMITFPIVNTRKSCIVQHFRSFKLWKSINDHVSNSKTAEIVHFAAVALIFAVKIDQ